MWRPPTPVEQELWNAVVAGVRAANQADRDGFQAAVRRLSRLPRPWTPQVLHDTADLLVEEWDPDGRYPWPLLAAQLDHVAGWLPEAEPRLLAALLDGGGLPAAGAPEDTADIRLRLLLVALLANVARVGVGAFVDVALAGNSGRTPRRLSGTVPHCRPGR
ncbi:MULTISPECIES: hypothetical protein [Micromonospora]|uniref:Uncharacterized protein n=1 Tax=Micromonospora solifontis TaxID=2487138 RepID=A0ABX9WK38_9ACTN|nr:MULTISPECIES: hypothetical protein [Micromonospora]NES13637.1 hypothetical protein [Micromonospora sp. PPF5-17B]NES35446.1 hypothetical protein [Micromonospora solifontis]NES55397.1 hypothetical protein [Micromonospora sp. PPF5-6]RNM00698.1 hypothetical protein EFE23_04610 [Micromonospora solifontis]